MSGRELVRQEAEDAKMCRRMEKKGVLPQNSLVSTIYPTTEEELANKREERLAKENEERLAKETEEQEMAQDQGRQSGPWASGNESESWTFAGIPLQSHSGRWTRVAQAISCWSGKCGYRSSGPVSTLDNYAVRLQTQRSWPFPPHYVNTID